MASAELRGALQVPSSMSQVHQLHHQHTDRRKIGHVGLTSSTNQGQIWADGQGTWMKRPGTHAVKAARHELVKRPHHLVAWTHAHTVFARCSTIILSLDDGPST